VRCTRVCVGAQDLENPNRKMMAADRSAASRSAAEAQRETVNEKARRCLCACRCGSVPRCSELGLC
jgi:hypothetical protein